MWGGFVFLPTFILVNICNDLQHENKMEDECVKSIYGKSVKYCRAISVWSKDLRQPRT